MISDLLFAIQFEVQSGEATIITIIIAMTIILLLCIQLHSTIVSKRKRTKKMQWGRTIRGRTLKKLGMNFELINEHSIDYYCTVYLQMLQSLSLKALRGHEECSINSSSTQPTPCTPESVECVEEDSSYNWEELIDKYNLSDLSDVSIQCMLMMMCLVTCHHVMFVCCS